MNEDEFKFLLRVVNSDGYCGIGNSKYCHTECPMYKKLNASITDSCAHEDAKEAAIEILREKYTRQYMEELL